MKRYNWEQADWPNFKYDLSNIDETLFLIAEKTGLLSGKLGHLTQDLQTETMVNLLVEEASKTSEIEGEYINRPDIRSSIRNKLGLNPKIVAIHDQRAQGIVDLLFDVRKTFKNPLTKNKLFEWHVMLFSKALNANIRIGNWRVHKAPMQIVSGPYGREVVHYEAPPSSKVPKEMEKFILWFNDTAPGKSKAIKLAPIRAAIAHLYFESIHPFEDGNGRIGRVVSEKALSQALGYPALFSLSKAIESDKKSYYAALEEASKSNEISAWIYYFVNIILQAQTELEEEIDFILKKAKFFDTFKDLLNERELKIVQRMMKVGVQGFEGGMSAKKYMSITGVSKATATRDLQHLHSINAFKQVGSGRSVRYDLNLEMEN